MAFLLTVDPLIVQLKSVKHSLLIGKYETQNHSEFDAYLVDQEVMEIEREITGWKMVLNTTEFLCCYNKEQFSNHLTLWAAICFQ